MKTVAIINQKGGVGKSTTALSIAAALREQGKDILLIDLDAQGNLSYNIGAKMVNYGAAGVLQRPETIKDEIQERGLFDIVPSAPALAAADKIIDGTGKEYKLREALEAVKGKYDYCIIDTPPTMGILTINALTACDSCVIPTQAEAYSLLGINQLNGTIETVRKYCNPSLKIAGIVITRFNGRTIVRREIAEQLERIAEQMHTRVFDTRIRECTALVEAAAMQQTIIEYAPTSNAARDYEALSVELQEVI